MYPNVCINYSSPTMNTCSKKRAIHAVTQDNIIKHGVETDDTLHFFMLPNTLDSKEIIQILQNDTHAYQLTQWGDGMLNYWKEQKRQRMRKRQWREMRKRAELLVRMKREL